MFIEDGFLLDAEGGLLHSPGRVTLAGPVSTQTFTYTAVGEVATAVRNDGTDCAAQVFGYDPDSNRTQHATATGCTPPTPTAAHTYDAADRLLDAGTAYDELGRTTTAAASTVAGGAAVTVGFFDNDMVRALSQTVAGVTRTQTFTLDPTGHRIISQTDSGTGQSVNHYGDSGDSPAWTSTLSGWTRNIDGLSGLGALHRHDNTAGTDTVTLQLADLGGNIAVTVDDTVGATPTGTYDYDPFGASAGTTPAPPRYGWLGAHQRAADTPGGLVLMGWRLYNPTTGRFLSVDPVPGGNANPYDYCTGDPINCTDLDGRFGWKKWLKRAATALAVVGFAACIVGTGGACAALGVAGLVASGASRAADTFESREDLRSWRKWRRWGAGTALDYGFNKVGGKAVRSRLTHRDFGGMLHYNSSLSISQARTYCRRCWGHVNGIVHRRVLRQTASFAGNFRSWMD